MNQPSQGQYGAPPAGNDYNSPRPGQYGVEASHARYGLESGRNLPVGPPGKGLGVLKLMLGICLSLGFFGALLHSGHEGIGEAAIIGGFMGIGLRWMVTGGANLAGKRIPLLPSFGIVLVGLAIGALAGPPISEATWRAQESSTWDELVGYTSEDSHVSIYEWDREYYERIPPTFQREEAPGMRKYVEVRTAIQNDDLNDLRRHVHDLAVNHRDDPHYKSAYDTASGELQRRYDTAMARLTAAGSEEAEFEVDEDLREGFKAVLQDLSRAASPDVYVAFTNRSELTKPEGSDQDVKEWFEEEPSVKASFPDGKVRVIDPGEAFSPRFDLARRKSFMEVAGKAFRDAFDANLLTLKPLEPGESRKDKIVLEVSSTIVRVPSHFNNYETDENGNQTSKGLLFGIVVDWSLKLFNRDGAELYARQTTSAPAGNINIGPGAMPDWGVYSILMDSAYFNYSREVVGSFGLEPPAEQRTFSYRDYGVTGG
jgi:hypothetical protein